MQIYGPTIVLMCWRFILNQNLEIRTVLRRQANLLSSKATETDELYASL